MIKRKSFSSKRRVYRNKMAKFKVAVTEPLDYKNPALLQKFLTDRGKIMSRRVTGITTKQQRDLSKAVKHARYLGLLGVGQR